MICQLRVFSGRSREGPGAAGPRGPGASSTATINSSLFGTDLVHACCPSIIIRASFHSQMCPDLDSSVTETLCVRVKIDPFRLNKESK